MDLPRPCAGAVMSRARTQSSGGLLELHTHGTSVLLAGCWGWVRDAGERASVDAALMPRAQDRCAPKGTPDGGGGRGDLREGHADHGGREEPGPCSLRPEVRREPSCGARAPM